MTRQDFYGTGIADEPAARRYLRRKFNQGPLEPIRRRPGARFYVSARGRRTVLLLGPYVSHMTALERVPRARGLLPGVVFVAVGTCSAPTTLPTRYGR
jgi:hypothetical protein